MALALVAASCSTPDNQPTEDHGEATDHVWITIGDDAVDTVTQLLPGVEITDNDKSSGVAVARVPAGDIKELSLIMHDVFKRCGGFFAHESQYEATKQVQAENINVGVLKSFASYTISNATTVQTLINSLNEQHIIDMISDLSSYPTRYHSTSSGYDAAVFLRDQWASFAAGRSDVSVALYNHPSSVTNQPSVVLTIQGNSLASEYVVLGAHLDSTASGSTAPGADDDASGIATLTAIIRSAMANNYVPERTVQFMGYAAEEVGLRGSNDIAQDYKNSGVNVVGVLQLDMTNYSGSGNLMTLIGDNTNLTQNQFVGNLIDTYVGLPWEYAYCNYGCSDHASWTSAGFPASMPFEARFSQYNPNIHTSGDTLAFLGNNADHAMNFAALGAAYLVEMGTPAAEPPPGDTVTENFSGSLSTGQEQQYGPFDVESGSDFLAQITGTGDADLYVRFGAPPTTSSWDCRPYIGGSSETCDLPVPSGQTQAYVMVRGYTAATYDLSVTYTPGSGSPPPPPPGTWDDLADADFESGWGPFTDGGSDCARISNSTYASSGSISARIRDNSGSASSFYSTSTVDLSGYDEVRIQFHYYPVGMENG
ncbi:MAG: M20/M25/M40 family metallo-hydrolase, partial [Myxococcota bacterium]